MKAATKMLSILALGLLLIQPVVSGAQGTAPAPAPASAIAATKPAMETKDYGDWRLECRSVKDGKKVCNLFQRIVAEEKENKKKHMMLEAKAGIFSEEGKDGKVKSVTRLLLITPLGTLLPAQLTLKLDEEKQVSLPFLVCAPEGCLADFVFEGALLEKIKKGKKLLVAYKRMNSKPITVGVSLNGFSAGLKALAEKKG